MNCSNKLSSQLAPTNQIPPDKTVDYERQELIANLCALVFFHDHVKEPTKSDKINYKADGHLRKELVEGYAHIVETLIIRFQDLIDEDDLKSLVQASTR
jgi:hypothetical protein